jgi:hypothetical protein
VTDLASRDDPIMRVYRDSERPVFRTRGEVGEYLASLAETAVQFAIPTKGRESENDAPIGRFGPTDGNNTTMLINCHSVCSLGCEEVRLRAAVA